MKKHVVAAIMAGMIMASTLTAQANWTQEGSNCHYVQENGSYIKGWNKLGLSAFPQMLLQYPTEEEIRAYYATHPFSTSKSDTWDITPDINNEVAGKLSQSSIENALNALNFVRYIAGLNPVTHDEELEEYAQAGTTLLQKVGYLSHRPEQPSGVSDEFYGKGWIGTSSSNLGNGYSNLAKATVAGWMVDGDEGNIDTVGHRRWCLDPHMQATGFGHSGTYTAMWVFGGNTSYEDYRYDYISWPGQVMPVEYFKGPWSVSLHESFYINDDADVKISLTSRQNEKTYVLDKNNSDKSGQYFNIAQPGYGYGWYTLIFDPGVNFAAGDEVTVEITGLKDESGIEWPISYKVTFFCLSKSSVSSDANTKQPVTPTLPAYVVKGNWSNMNGQWKFADSSGAEYKNRWAAVYNPYANTIAGQSIFDWFRFDGAGNMVTGWFEDTDGNYYYMNSTSDGTKGRMLTGWNWIADASGVQKCYYFSPVSDGYRGKLLTNTTVDGYSLNSTGEWIQDGIVQIKK